jgi:hypothetical protein
MFSKSVLPKIEEMFLDEYIQSKDKQMQKNEFGELILSLRKTKYPKELIRLFRTKDKDFSPDMVFAINGSDGFDLSLVFVFPNKNAIPDQFSTIMNEISNKAPLSKYGISVDINATSVSGFVKEWAKKYKLTTSKSLYLYENGRFYAWEKEFDPDTVIKNMETLGKPPLK